MASSTSPVAVSGLSVGVTTLAAGVDFSLAIQNGAVYSWGSNQSGQLGDGTTSTRYTPVPVTTLGRGVTAVAAGGSQSLAVANGEVYAWGNNTYGQLGNGSTANSSVPSPVSGLSQGATAVAGGSTFSLALSNGGVSAWGLNTSGQLGNGSTATTSTTPVPVTGLTSGVTLIAAGGSHGLAVRNGGLFAWGSGSNGQLGNGTTTPTQSTPVGVLGLTSGVTAIAGGGIFSLAVQNGHVFAWGYNGSGQLGDGTTTSRSTPEQIDTTDLKNIVAVAAGAYSSYALSADGSLWVWGDNFTGELGLGNTTSYSTPQHLLPPAGYVFTSIESDSGATHALAILGQVPEPSTWALLGVGACLLGVTVLRRRAAHA